MPINGSATKSAVTALLITNHRGIRGPPVLEFTIDYSRNWRWGGSSRKSSLASNAR
jgi:hypothetical protein